MRSIHQTGNESTDGQTNLNSGDFGLQTNFALLDLVSQRKAVRKLLRDVDVQTKLVWIESHGSIRTITHPGFRTTYVFESRLGFTAGFFFDDEDDFVFLGDHYTFK